MARERRFFIYSYWTDLDKVIKDKRCSIIPSIATLRHFTDDPICVIDYSNSEWENYPSRLDFRVVKKKPYLEGHDKLQEFNKKTLSRTFDVWNEATKSKIPNIVAVDADIFWLDNFDCDFDKINFFKGPVYVNTGCYTFSLNDSKFFEKSLEITQQVLSNKEFLSRIQIECEYPWLNDELIFIYTRKMYPELVSQQKFRCNHFLDKMFLTIPKNTPENIHVIRCCVPKQLYSVRCGCLLMIKELVEKIHCLPDFCNLFEETTNYSLCDFLGRGAEKFHKELEKISGIK